MNNIEELKEISNKKYIPVRISPKKCSIPTSSGLGSSATCVVAGVIAGNYMLKNVFTKEELLSVMALVEGHPDNVATAFLGGLTLSYKDGERVVSRKVEVSKKLKFYAVIPAVSLKTTESRSLLPETVPLADAVSNVTRALNLQTAFEKGDIELIKAVFEDKLHQPYRLPIIKGASEMKKVLEDLGYAVAVSGAGPSLIAITNKANENAVIPKNVGGVKWRIKPLKVCERGATFV